jgi:cyclophilin family peptidyl-prolyl cis-trans isomerase
MANHGPHTNASQWFITLRPLASFDSKFVSFGRVIAGLATIRTIAEVPAKNQRPIAPVVISNCGVFEP